MNKKPFIGDIVETATGIYKVTDVAEFDDLVRGTGSNQEVHWFSQNEILTNFSYEARAGG